MNPMPARLNQVAIVVESREASSAFYRDLLDLRRVGSAEFKGRPTETVQALPGAHMVGNWHMDDREFFQLELFEYATPKSRPFARIRQPWDIGYSRIALEVADLQATHRACEQRSVEGLSAIRTLGDRPYFSMRDPNGVLIEVGLARRPAGAPQRTRLVGVALSVPELAVALKSFGEGLGCPVLDASPPDKGVLWQEPPASKRSVVLDAGPVWLEISEYARPRPAPWPKDYRICDFGIMNVAFGFRQVPQIRAAHQRMVAAGFKPNSQLFGSMGQVVIGYLTDPQGFSVELEMVRPWLDGLMGFRPETRKDQLLRRVLMALA